MSSTALHPIHWRVIAECDDILIVRADQSVVWTLDEAVNSGAKWVVIVRMMIDNSIVRSDHYVFSYQELAEITDGRREDVAADLETACALSKWQATPLVDDLPDAGATTPFVRVPPIPEMMPSTRHVRLDWGGVISSIGLTEADVAWEVNFTPKDRGVAVDGIPDPTPDTQSDDILADLSHPGIVQGAVPVSGRVAMPGQTDRPDWHVFSDFYDVRSGARQPNSSVKDPAERQPADESAIAIKVSAEAESRIKVGARSTVPFRVECADGAMPLASFLSVVAHARDKIRVVLSVENDTVRILSEATRSCDPPDADTPREDLFIIQAVRAGRCRLSVSFWQGGGELGTIGLAVEVVADAPAASDWSARTGWLAEPQAADRDKLTILVEQRRAGDTVRYHYKLHSDALNLDFKCLDSKPLRDRGGGTVHSTLAYFEHVYERLTSCVNPLNPRQFEADVAALGIELDRAPRRGVTEPQSPMLPAGLAGDVMLPLRAV